MRPAPKDVIAGVWLAGALIPLWMLFDGGFGGAASRDFSNLWVAGKMVLAGGDVYDLEAMRAFGTSLLGGHIPFNYTYPPFALFVAVPFSFLPLNTAFVLWNVLSVLFFYWAARPWMPKGLSPILAILTPPVFINCMFGQYGLVAAALWLLAFNGSGISAALLTFKPHIGFLVAWQMVRDRKALPWAIGGTVALIVLSGVAFGFSTWPSFIRHALGFQAGSLVNGSEAIWVVSGVTPAIGYGFWGWIPFALGGALLLVRNFNVFTAATATFLISPYGFHYDMAAVSLGFGILIYMHWNDMPPLHRALAVLAFVCPGMARMGTWWVPPILFAGLWVQVKYGCLRSLDGESLGLWRHRPRDAGSSLVDDHERHIFR